MLSMVKFQTKLLYKSIEGKLLIELQVKPVEVEIDFNEILFSTRSESSTRCPT